MKKTLLLLLFAVFAMGFVSNAAKTSSINCDTVNTIDVLFYLYDDNGSGWNTNQLKVTYTFESNTHEKFMEVAGSYAVDTITIDNGTAVTMDWIANYPEVVNRYFKVKYWNGVKIYDSPIMTTNYHGDFVGSCIEATRDRVVTVVSNPTVGGDVYGGGDYDAMSTDTLSADPNSGYLFNNWTVDGNVVATTNIYSFNVDDDYDFVGNFYNYNGLYIGAGENNSGFIPTNTTKSYFITEQIYTANDGIYAGTINSIAFYNEGLYENNGIITNQSRTMDIYMIGIDTLKTVFTGKKDWLSVSSADIVYSGAVTIPSGEWYNINLTNNFILEEGKNLAIIINDHTGTSTSSANKQLGRIIDGEGNQTLYASGLSMINPTTISSSGTLLPKKNQIILGYSSQSFTITASVDNADPYNIVNGGTVQGAGTYNSGSTCTLIATPDAGYEFKYWKDGNTIVSDDAEYTFTVESDKNLTAYFGSHWLPIIGHNATATVTGVISINGVRQTNPMLEVYAFCGDECRGVAKTKLFPPANTYIATLTVRSMDAAHDTIHFRLYDYDIQQEYDICDSIIVFEQEGIWGTYDPINNNSWYLFDFYTEQEVTASVYPDNAGNVTGAGMYKYGTPATLTAIPNEGYVFTNWTVNDTIVSTDNPYVFDVTESVDLVANFEIVISAIPNPSVGGSVTGAGNYAYGAMCELTATPNSGYEFINWTKGGIEVSDENTFVIEHVEEPGEYVANFNSIMFDIMAYANPSDAGSITGAGTYMYGAHITLKATANTGYAFVNWTKDNVVVSTNASINLIVEGAATYYANFTGKQEMELCAPWTWWSIAIETDNSTLEILEDSLGHNGLMIKSHNDAVRNYYSQLGYDYWYDNTNFEINNESCYLIKTATNDVVTMIGEYADPANHEINIQGYHDTNYDYAWTWIGYPVNIEQEVHDALDDSFIPENSDMIKSQGGAITYYAASGVWWSSDEFRMTPGCGYKYQSKSYDNKPLTFVKNGNSSSNAKNTPNHYWKNNPYAYADNMVIFATAIVANEEQHDADLELGAFVDGVCRGRTHMKYFEPLNRYIALMTVSGEKGDVVEFGLVNANRNLISLDCADYVTFESDAIIGSLDEPFEVHFSAMQEFSRSQLEMFPNPVSRNETVSFNLPDDEMVKEVVVTNAVGAVVKHNASSLTMIGEGMPMSGVYMVKVICNSGNVYIGKLIVK